MSNLITTPGIYDISNAAYHADPCAVPSLSRSFIQTLNSMSPMHARLEHPRLNPNFEPKDNKDFDLGTAAHSYLLEGSDKTFVLEFPDYRTNAAKDARAAAIAQGLNPILRHKFAGVELMHKALVLQIKAHADHPDAFQNGKAEQSYIWEEGGVWFRARPDFVCDNGWIDEYKTTGVIGPQRWIDGNIGDGGYDLQAYMCMRGYHKIHGKNCKGVRFWVQEDFEPFAVYCVELDETFLHQAEEKFMMGKLIFDNCMRRNSWPGYPNKTIRAFPGYRANASHAALLDTKTAIELTDGDLHKIWNSAQAPIGETL